MSHYYSDALSNIISIAIDKLYPVLAGGIDVIPLITWRTSKEKGTISMTSHKLYALYKKMGGKFPRTNVVVITLNMKKHVVPSDEGITVSPTSVLYTVDHELSHIALVPQKGTELEEEVFIVKLIDHDIEDFISVMRRWREWGAAIAGANPGLTTDMLVKQLAPIEVETKAVREYIQLASEYMMQLAEETIKSGIIPTDELHKLSQNLIPQDDE